MRKNNIVPIDVSSSREYYGLNNSTDVYKGTSFKFSGEWATNIHYFNDEYIIDFVSWNGSLWACQRNHLSTTGTEPNINSRFWTEVITGIEGKAYVPKLVDGKLIFDLEGNPPQEPIDLANFKGEPGDNGIDGLTYKPDSKLEGNYIVFRTERGDVVKVDFSQFKGEKGDTGDNGKDGADGKDGINGKDGKSWIFSKAVVTTIDPDSPAKVSMTEDYPGDTNTTYTLNLWVPQGKQGKQGLKGDTGKQGLRGDRGPANELRIDFDPKSGMSILYYSIEGTGKWERLGPVGGTPGKSPKLIREKGDPNIKEDDRIIWGYDGVPVSEWTTLCYLDELRGDNNIAYGTPDDFEGGAPPTDKIWYDPSDEAVDSLSASEFLYLAYNELGGVLSKEEFEKIFTSLNGIKGFEIIFKDVLPLPSDEWSGKLVITPKSTSDSQDMFDEWVVVEIESGYKWEKWGSGSINLPEYYTKDEVYSKDETKKMIEDSLSNYYTKDETNEILEDVAASSIWSKL